MFILILTSQKQQISTLQYRQWGKGIRVSIGSLIISLILNGFHGIERRVANSEWFFWGLFKCIVSAILGSFFLEFLLNLFIFVLFIARQLQFKTKGYLCSRYLSTWYLVNFVCLLAFLIFYLFIFSKHGLFWLIELNRNDPKTKIKFIGLQVWLT